MWLTMAVEDEEPDQGKNNPGEIEGGSEAKQCPGPGEIYHWGKEIFQIPTILYNWNITETRTAREKGSFKCTLCDDKLAHML